MRMLIKTPAIPTAVPTYSLRVKVIASCLLAVESLESIVSVEGLVESSTCK